MGHVLAALEPCFVSSVDSGCSVEELIKASFKERDLILLNVSIESLAVDGHDHESHRQRSLRSDPQRIEIGQELHAVLGQVVSL